MPIAPKEVGNKFCVEYNPAVTNEGSVARAALIAQMESQSDISQVQIIGDGSASNPNQFRDPDTGALLLSQLRLIPAQGSTKAQARAAAETVVVNTSGIRLCGEAICPNPVLVSDVEDTDFTGDKTLQAAAGLNQDSGWYKGNGILAALDMLQIGSWHTFFSGSRLSFYRCGEMVIDNHGDLVASTLTTNDDFADAASAPAKPLSFEFLANFVPRVRTSGGAYTALPQWKIDAGDKIIITADGGQTHELEFAGDLEIFTSCSDTIAAGNSAMQRGQARFYLHTTDEGDLYPGFLDGWFPPFTGVGVTRTKIVSGGVILAEQVWDNGVQLVSYNNVKSAPTLEAACSLNLPL